MRAGAGDELNSDPDAESNRLRRRLERERQARREAEAIAERSSRQLHDRNRELELLASVAEVANRARTIDEALAFALDGLCRHLKWPLAQGWVRDGDVARLRCSPACFAADDARFTPFLVASRTRRFGPGEGLPGRVLVAGEPVWIADLGSDVNFPRAGLAHAAGLHTGVGFPVMLEGDVVAVLECFVDSETTISTEIMNLVSGLGELLAQVFERDRGARRLRHEARHDALTGLPNRVLFHERLAQMIEVAQATDLGLAVAVLDVDRFKEVNDTLGHEHGDQLLVEVGRRLGTALGRDDLIARLGGDEFALVLPRVRDERDAAVVAAKIAAAMREPVRMQDVLIGVDVSVGIALHPRDGEQTSALLRHADVAMYAAKRARAGHLVYTTAANPHSVYRLGLLSDLREAIESEQLTLHYQPKIDAVHRRVQGVEALVRWTHPLRGAVSPAEFIPLAERTGLIGPLTVYVLRTALTQAARWSQSGLDIPVAVNIAPRTLLEEEFPAQIAEALRVHGVPARLLELEVTEGSMLEDPVRAREALVALDELGVSIAIDDFGSGFSSLAQLKVLPVDCLKIDRSFVSAMTVDERDGFIVAAAVRLAHDLGMTVVAEGVEDEATLQALVELECDTAQGYLLHRPAAAAALEEWLRTESPLPVAAAQSR